MPSRPDFTSTRAKPARPKPSQTDFTPLRPPLTYWWPASTSPRIHNSRRERLDRATLTSVRDRLTAELLSVRACVMSGEDPERHLDRVVELAAPEHLVRVVLEEGDVVARLVRSAAERVGVIEAEQFATALGSPPRRRHSADAFVT